MVRHPIKFSSSSYNGWSIEITRMNFLGALPFEEIQIVELNNISPFVETHFQLSRGSSKFNHSELV